MNDPRNIDLCKKLVSGESPQVEDHRFFFAYNDSTLFIWCYDKMGRKIQYPLPLIRDHENFRKELLDVLNYYDEQYVKGTRQIHDRSDPEEETVNYWDLISP